MEPMPERSALVQGASRGLGLALATRLLESGRASRIFATARHASRSEGLAALVRRFGDIVQPVNVDVTDAASIGRCADLVARRTDRLHWLVNCAGLLHDGPALQPEKRLEQIDAEALRRVFEVNAFAPVLMARAFLPLLDHDGRSVLANVSARVGSIEDNRLGGWYAYRASKAAQNMFTRTLAIELGRRVPRCICVALHPGTVDTALSVPFQRNVPDGKLFSPDFAADRLLDVIDGLGEGDSGRFIAWDGSPIPW
jgi:NAD(P)-dependent dehydrogenase (short-subunit alcohol dehydrogenase family)